MDIFKIIEKPVITERASLLKEQGNKYVFRTVLNADKREIKHAIEEIFKVDVIKVNTSIMHGKKRRMGRFEGKRSDWKKAIVTLKEGQEIKTAGDKV